MFGDIVRQPPDTMLFGEFTGQLRERIRIIVPQPGNRRPLRWIRDARPKNIRFDN